MHKAFLLDRFHVTLEMWNLCQACTRVRSKCRQVKLNGATAGRWCSTAVVRATSHFEIICESTCVCIHCSVIYHIIVFGCRWKYCFIEIYTTRPSTHVKSFKVHALTKRRAFPRWLVPIYHGFFIFIFAVLLLTFGKTNGKTGKTVWLLERQTTRQLIFFSHQKLIIRINYREF